MVLQLRHATPADVPAIARIGVAAFDPSTDVMMRNLFPAHLQPADDPTGPQYGWRVWRKTAKLDDKDCVIMVVVDDTTTGPEDNIVGFSLWDGPASGEPEPKKESVPASKDPGFLAATRAAADPEAGALIHEVVDGGARAVFGERGYRDAWYLSFLAVHPRHHRRGIGKTLLEWGVEKAAAEKRDCFLVATPAGMPLYLAHGFEQVGTMDFFGTPHASMMIKNDPRWKA